MNIINKIWKDKKGQSPIISIILMIAITVVLVVTIWAWVQGFGESEEDLFCTISLDQKELEDNDLLEDCVTYEVASVYGNPEWGDVKIKINNKSIWNEEIIDGWSITVNDVMIDPEKEITRHQSLKIMTTEDPFKLNRGDDMSLNYAHGVNKDIPIWHAKIS